MEFFCPSGDTAAITASRDDVTSPVSDMTSRSVSHAVTSESDTAAAATEAPIFIVIDPTPFPCATCRNRCGETSNTIDAGCSCDAACEILNDCCHDYSAACPDEHTITQQIRHKHKRLIDLVDLRTHAQRFVACMTVPPYSTPIAMIGHCPDDVTACNMGVSFDIPVRDNDTGIDFVNAKCARCNNVTNGQLWPFEVKGPNCDIPGVEKNSLLNVTSLSDINATAEYGCSLGVSKIPSVYHPCNRAVNATCDVTCHNNDVIDQCRSYGIEPVMDANSVLYRNKHCAFCSSHTDVSLNLQCRVLLSQIDGSWMYLWHYDVALVYDASQPDGLALRCDDGFVYIDGDVGCEAKLSCPDGFIALSGECEQMDGSTSWATTDDDNGTNHAPQTVTSFAADGDTGATASLAARSMGHFLTLQSVLVFINTGLVLNRHQ